MSTTDNYFASKTDAENHLSTGFNEEGINVDSTQQSNNEDGNGHASVSQTIINMAKTCAGTGALALPFAARQGGILLHVMGLLLVGGWNVWTVQRLCACYDLVIGDPSTGNDVDETFLEEALPLKRSQTSITSSGLDDSMQSYQSTLSRHGYQPESINDNNQKQKKEPPKGTTTLVKLAWFALGPVGANILDVIMVIYLLGVILTYVNGMRSFLADTPFTTGIGFVDAFLLVAIMGPLSMVNHTGHLAKASAMGLLVLFATFVVIAWYGFVIGHASDDSSEQHNRWHVLTGDNAQSIATPATIGMSPAEESSIWLPHNGLAGVSQWFGSVVFSFGIAPLTFNFRQAMAEPHLLVPATKWAMLLVAVSYIVVGAGLLYPFPDIDGDVLHELPSTGFLPTTTRLAMVLVVLVTAPLLIVPCGELLEGKFVGSVCHQEEPEKAWRLKAVVRWGICLVCASISVFVPGFVNVLSFVGCLCVACVGFVIPPFLHLILSLKAKRGRDESRGGISSEKLLAPSIWVDAALLLWGLLATIVGTIYTFQEVSS